MNIIHKLSALPAAALALLLLLSSCEVTPLQGEEDVITFSAVTGYDSSTKTSYSGVTGGTPAKERIDWVAGDRFKLACAQTTPTSSDYEIDATGIMADGAKSHAMKIVPVPTGTFPNGTPKTSGLKWGTDWPHQFYAVYPSTASLSASGQISATVPASQSPRATEPVTTTTSGGKTIARVHPDMNNCLMWSGTSVASKGKFTLRFTPMVTTFQFTVGGDGTGAGDITISSVELLSSNVALCGGLTAQVTGTGATAEIAQRGGSVSYTLPSSGTGSSVTFTLPANTKINDTQSLTFTLFVYPTGRTVGGEDILDGLTVKYNTSVGARSLALKYSTSAQTNPGAWVQFPAGRKINIENLQLPAQLEYWRYSITIGNHEEEISDVAVNPVEVEEWDEEDYPYALDEHYFSVSSTRKVKFAPGNLVVTYKSDGNHLWEFEKNQWDYSYGTGAGESYEGQSNYEVDGTRISHFGWATAGVKNGTNNYGYDPHHEHYQPYSIAGFDIDNGGGQWYSDNIFARGPSVSTTEPYVWANAGGANLPYGNVEGNSWNYGSAWNTVRPYCDWGVHFNDKGEGDNGRTDGIWYTLSAYEWDYLFNRRDNSTALVGKGRIYVEAENKYVNGLIILPDNWVLPSGCSPFTSGTTRAYETNLYTTGDADDSFKGQWSEMEAAGAAFLPAAGQRTTTSSSTRPAWYFERENIIALYWSSSAHFYNTNHMSTYSYYIHTYTSGMDLQPIGPRYIGRSVRLVRDIN